MNDTDIDEILRRAADPTDVDPAILSRVTTNINSRLKPVRPIAHPLALTAGLFALSILIAAGAAYAIGFSGIQKLSGLQIALIFGTLALSTWLAAVLSVDQMIPGRARFMNPMTLVALVVLAFLAVDAVLFHNYEVSQSVPQGITCLRAGIEVAVPTAVASWLILHRGFAVNPASAGVAAGTLAGIAGVIMLELHCPNLSAMHVMVWHTAVIPISALAAALAASIYRQARTVARRS